MWHFFVPFRKKVQGLLIGDLIMKYHEYGFDLTLKSKDFSIIQSNNRGQSFDNRENFYLKLIDLLKRFAVSTSNNLLTYVFEHLTDLRHQKPEILRQMRLDHLNDFVTRLEVWRRSSDDFQIILALLCFQSKKLVKLYLKMRAQILKYTDDKTQSAQLNISNHNVKKFERKEYTVDSISVGIDLWGVLAGKIVEATNYHDQTDRVLHFIREAELKEHSLDSIMKVKATTMLLVALCVVNYADRLLGKQKPRDNPQNIQEPEPKKHQKKLDQPKDAFLNTLMESRGLRNSNWRQVSLRKLQIQEVMPKTMKVNELEIPEMMTSPKSQKPRIDYGYRLAPKPAETKTPIKLQQTPGSQTKRHSDPLIEDIRKYMKRYARQLTREFTATK